MTRQSTLITTPCSVYDYRRDKNYVYPGSQENPDVFFTFSWLIFFAFKVHGGHLPSLFLQTVKTPLDKSVLFSDIVGFTSFTDQADPAEVQAVLEEYFADMAAIIFENKGIVDKYMGDGILAFFENPPDGVTSAQASVKTAMEMKKKAEILDQKYKDQKRFPFAICVGIATGYAKVGIIGTKEKIDYTIIGSVVNLCSRLEGIGEKGDVILDNDTYTFIKDDYQTQDLGKITLKGFEKSIHAHKLKN